MLLFKKESKEERRKKAIIKVLKYHAHLLEELFTEELISCSFIGRVIHRGVNRKDTRKWAGRP